MFRNMLLGIGVTVLLWGLMALVPASAQPDGGNPYVWTPSTKSVAVFKNGYGYFTREGETQLRDGWCMTAEMPAASLGTFVIYSTAEGEVVDIVGSGSGEVVAFDGEDAPDTLAARQARLESLLALKVELNYTAKGSNRTATGKLIALGETHAILEDEANQFAVPVAGVSRLKVLDHPVRVHVDGTPSQPEGGTGLGMGYLTSGIRWVPEYTLRILDDETAELTLRGTLVNDAEDLIDCDVHFVVGAPNFAHADKMSPLAIQQLVRTVGASMPAGMSNTFGNGSTTVQFLNAPQPEDGTFESNNIVWPSVISLPEMNSPAATDYTVYTKEGLTVRNGERAAVTLFVRRITYEHLYRWSPPSPLRHCLQLKNADGSAWTTGPCLVISGERPLSEDTLRYTPAGSVAEFPVTDAINISHDRQEEEKDREFQAYTFGAEGRDKSLDLVTLEGTLRLVNHEEKSVQIAIDLPVQGRPTSASDGGRMRLETDVLSLTERRGTIQWRIEMAPGATRELTYGYERVVETK